MNKASLAGALTVLMLFGSMSAGHADDVGAANESPIGRKEVDSALRDTLSVTREDDTRTAAGQPVDPEAETPADVQPSTRPDDMSVAAESPADPEAGDEAANDALPVTREDDTWTAAERPLEAETPADVQPPTRPDDMSVAAESPADPEAGDEAANDALPVTREDDMRTAAERPLEAETPADVQPPTRPDDMSVAAESPADPEAGDEAANDALPVTREDDTRTAAERPLEAETPADVQPPTSPDDVRVAAESPAAPEARDEATNKALPVTCVDDMRVVAERLLGHEDTDEALRELLPFTRQIAVTGRIAGTVHASTATVGVPRAAMLEALQAFATTMDLEREVRDGDRFHVRYEQAFAAAGAPIGIGRVLWAELVTATRGTISIHRFRPHGHVERFWLANGQAATPPWLRLPLEAVSISSGFGLRADPFDQPPPLPTAGIPGAMGGPLRRPPSLPPGLKARTSFGELPLSSSAGQSSYGSLGGGSWQHAPRPTRPMFMHEGVDFVASSGTQVLAAADGVVIGAGPNGRYGNWIRIDHADKLATVYGHLSDFAPGIEAGSIVSRGELIGYVGSTGRSTGAHLHFELLADGKPVNPINHPETRRGALRGPDLERLRKQVAQSVAEREREEELATNPYFRQREGSLGYPRDTIATDTGGTGDIARDTAVVPGALPPVRSDIEYTW